MEMIFAARREGQKIDLSRDVDECIKTLSVRIASDVFVVALFPGKGWKYFYLCCDDDGSRGQVQRAGDNRERIDSSSKLQTRQMLTFRRQRTA
jgi:hypothetical protein